MSPFVLERIRQMRGTNSESPNPVNQNESNSNQNENANTNLNNEEEARANASMSNSDTLSNNSTVDNSNNDTPLWLTNFDYLIQNGLLLNENLEWNRLTTNNPQSSEPATNRTQIRARSRNNHTRLSSAEAQNRRILYTCSVFVLLFAIMIPILFIVVFNRIFSLFS